MDQPSSSPVNRFTRKSENITFPRTTHVVGNNNPRVKEPGYYIVLFGYPEIDPTHFSVTCTVHLHHELSPYIDNVTAKELATVKSVSVML